MIDVGVGCCCFLDGRSVLSICDCNFWLCFVLLISVVYYNFLIFGVLF
jgi:hypothetical protein